MDRVKEIVENAVKPTRGARVSAIQGMIAGLRPDAPEANKILDALIGAMKYGFDDADLVDVLDRAAGLTQALEALDLTGRP